MSLNEKVTKLEQDILILAGEVKVERITSSDPDKRAHLGETEDLLGELLSKLQEVKSELGVVTNIREVKGHTA